MTELSREEWLAKRQEFLTASDVAAVLGVSPYGGPLSVYEKKITGYTIEDNNAMAFGREVEGVIANQYTRDTGRGLVNRGETALSIHPDLPWLAATLDRDIVSPGADDEGEGAYPAPLECKSVNPRDQKIYPADWEIEPPLHYQIQLQVQMACIQATWGSLVGLFPGYELAICDLEFDSDLWAGAVPILEEFWHKVKTRTPPHVDTLPCTLDVVKRLYPRDDGATLVLDAAALDLSDRWEAAKTSRKESEDHKKHLEAEIRAVLGGATFGRLPDGTYLSLKTTKRKAYTRVVEAGEYRTLRRSRPKAG